ERIARIERPDSLPGLQLHGTLEVGAPAQVLGAGRAEQRAVAENHWLVLDRYEDPAEQPTGGGPSDPAIRRGGQHAPPAARARPDLVEQEQRAVRSLMEDGVPTRLGPAAPIRTTRHFER